MLYKLVTPPDPPTPTKSMARRFQETVLNLSTGNREEVKWPNLMEPFNNTITVKNSSYEDGEEL